jgi:hypothetical protein
MISRSIAPSMIGCSHTAQDRYGSHMQRASSRLIPSSRSRVRFGRKPLPSIQSQYIDGIAMRSKLAGHSAVTLMRRPLDTRGQSWTSGRGSNGFLSL